MVRIVSGLKVPGNTLSTRWRNKPSFKCPIPTMQARLVALPPRTTTDMDSAETELDKTRSVMYPKTQMSNWGSGIESSGLSFWRLTMKCIFVTLFKGLASPQLFSSSMIMA